MDAAIVTVGDELLAGDIENTNATWLASRLTERGVDVGVIVTVPDDRDLIAGHVRRAADGYDAVVVTGGVGGTPDDVTMDGVAAAFDRPLEVNDEAYEDVLEALEERRAAGRDVRLDVEAESSIPAGSRPLINGAGISPGCVLENVYVLPGIPDEMKAMFGQVAGEFEGSRRSLTTHTSHAESNIAGLLERAEEEFDVSVGCYPSPDGGEKRITVTADDDERLRSAYDWLTGRLDGVGSS